MGSIPPGESVFLGGDLNGHVGEQQDGYEGVHGGMGYGIKNAEGESILEFGSAMDLAICNTFFKKAENHLVTYASGKSRSQIDYVLVRKFDRKNVSNVKVISGIECVQQHRLVIAVINIGKESKKRKMFAPRLKLRLLKCAEGREKFQEGLQEKAEAVSTATSVEEKWKTMRDAWLNSAEEVCGWTKGKRKQKETWWWNDDVEEAVKMKRDKFRRWKKFGVDQDHREYLEAKRVSRRVIWNAKDAKCREFAEELETDNGRKNFFKIAKQMAKDRNDITEPLCMKDENGSIKFGDDVKEVWRKYMEKLMNEENEWDGVVDCEPIQGPKCQLSESEFEKALTKCSSGKAAGPSGVAIEMIKASGGLGIQWMTELCNTILQEGRIPTDWTRSTLIPFYKNKGDPLECGSYRGIKLLEQTLKLYERVLEVRIRKQVNINDMQFGFMPGKGTTDAIFITRQVQEKHLAKKKELYFAFVDLEKAFDRVPREVVRWALRVSQVDEWLVEAVMALFEEANTVIRTGAGDSNSFHVKVGVHQGSVLSPLLFAIVMDAVTEAARGGLPWEVLYADDLVLMSDNEEDLMRKIAEWRGCLRSKGLKVNTGKTKVMVSAVGAGETRKAGAYPCRVCNKGVGSNSIQCTNCKNWVHRRCSDVKGSLTAVEEDFTCKKCKGNLQRPSIVGDGEFLKVEGEKYGVVTSFC